MLGLTTCALLPVALARNRLIRLVFGTELMSRQEDISIHKQGGGKVFLTILLATTLFFAVFIPIDCAGTRSMSFMATRFLLSVALSSAVSYYVAGVLAPREADRWN
jgi:multidrug efflux pump subunit AcrB